MFYDNTYNTQNYNYFAFNKVTQVINGYNYALPIYPQQQHPLMHPQYDELFAQQQQQQQMRPQYMMPNNGMYLMDDFYNFNNARIKRYKASQCVNTLDRTEYISESAKKYQKQLLKQQSNWKNKNDPYKQEYLKLNQNYAKSTRSTATTTTTTTKSTKKSKKSDPKFTYDSYAKYNTHYEMKQSSKSSKETRKTPEYINSKTQTLKYNDLEDEKRTPRSIRVKNSSILTNSAHSSEASKSRLTESTHSSSKSSDKLANPPPAPPLTEDIFKPIDNSFLFTRKKKLRKPLLIEADEIASKSFDAVVDELKFKLEKMRTSDENLSHLNALLNKTTSVKETQRAESPKIVNSIKYSDNFKQLNDKISLSQSMNIIEKTQSNSSIFSNSTKSVYFENKQSTDTKSNKSVNMDTNSKLSVSSHYSSFNKKPLESCSSFDSQDSSKLNSSKKTNSVKFSTTNTVSNDKNFKLEIYEDSNGEESDDYTKYTRLKFTPTPNKNETSKFIDDKINYNENDEIKKPVNDCKQSLEFFTQNFVKHKKLLDLDTDKSKLEQYRNEFKETSDKSRPPAGQCIKIVQKNQEKSFSSFDSKANRPNETKSDTSSSGIDSSHFLNSDDDLNHNSNKSILKTNSMDNFLIPSKFSSFTDYNLSKKLETKDEAVSSKNEVSSNKINSQFEFNNFSDYNQLCDQISDFVTMQNNYFSTEFELTNDDNQMLNKYLNEMTSYYQNLNNQDFENNINE